jgi:hypothetical protein
LGSGGMEPIPLTTKATTKSNGLIYLFCLFKVTITIWNENWNRFCARQGIMFKDLKQILRKEQVNFILNDDFLYIFSLYFSSIFTRSRQILEPS